MVELPIIVQIKQFHEGIDLSISYLYLVCLAVLIRRSEFISELSELLQGYVSEGENFFLDVVHIVNETLECDEFLERHLAFQFNLVYAFQVPGDLVGWEADKQGFGEVLQGDGVFLVIDDAVLMKFVVTQGCLKFLTEVGKVSQSDILLTFEEGGGNFVISILEVLLVS